MQPFQQAEEEIRRQKDFPLKAAGTILGSAGFISKAAPFLSRYVPASIGLKGISRLNKKIGNFINRSQDEGFNDEEIKGFLQERLSEKPPQEERNIIEQYSPELFTFMKDQIGKGRHPLEAGALARMKASGRDFDKVIRKIEQDHKTDWSAIVQNVFGDAQQSRTSMQPTEATSSTSPGNADQQLMAMMEKFSQALRG